MSPSIYPFQAPIHPLATQICYILQQAGYQSYIVGGCVRDLHLKIVPKDYDICTNASPEIVTSLFPKTIPTGLKHGTVTVCMDEGVENHFEVTTFRVEGKYLDGRRPEEVKFVQSITEDLSRRDFTINAMAFDPIANVIMDPFNGKLDLQRKIIKAVGDANARFQEDGLRIMRAARFAARFGFDIDADTFIGMKDNLETLKKVSQERINDELCKILMSANPVKGLVYLKGIKVLDIICPHLMSSPLFSSFLSEQNKCQGELETRLAFMYSNCIDIPQVIQELTQLKFSNKSIKRVKLLLELLNKLADCHDHNTKENYIDFMTFLKNYGPDWEEVLEQFLKLTEPLGNYAAQLLKQYQLVIVIARRELELNGDNLLDIGIKSGPYLKELLDKCYQEVLRYPEHNNREYLLEMVRKFNN